MSHYRHLHQIKRCNEKIKSKSKPLFTLKSRRNLIKGQNVPKLFLSLIWEGVEGLKGTQKCYFLPDCKHGQNKLEKLQSGTKVVQTLIFLFKMCAFINNFIPLILHSFFNTPPPPPPPPTPESMLSKVKERLKGLKYSIGFRGRGWGYKEEGHRYVHCVVPENIHTPPTDGSSD